MNKLFFGDNLTVLREKIGDRTADLIYLDPPFNSNANYSLIHTSPVGDISDAQRRAFKDTWRWEEDAAPIAMEEVRARDIGLFNLLRALQSSLGETDLMAYLVMMSVRLIELRRVLKDDGSIYLHCDTTASHYLKIILDQIFGTERFMNEVTWRRTSAHNDPQRYGRIQDRIFFYSKGKKKKFHPQGGEYSDEQLARYKYKDGDRSYKAENLTAPHYSATRTVEWRGVHPGANRQWRFSTTELDRLWDEGRILTRRDGKPRKDGLKEFLDENEAPVLQDIWTDIKRVGNTATERLGYQTQKPVALMDRIIRASSDPGDVVLDPFCGCGTTIHAAELLGRQWIGIDVAYAAIQVIEDRLSRWLPAAKYKVDGIPTAESEARALARLDPHTFQEWAVATLGGQPRPKGADRGIDGEIAFLRGRRDYGRGIVSVKAGQNVNPGMIRDLVGVVNREGADFGVFVCVNAPTREMKLEASRTEMVDLPGGRRHRVQIVMAQDLVDGPDIGIPTALNIIEAAEHARAAARRRNVPAPSPQDLRREPPLPPMPLKGGKVDAAQPGLPIWDDILVPPPAEPLKSPSRRRRRG